MGTFHSIEDSGLDFRRRMKQHFPEFRKKEDYHASWSQILGIFFFPGFFPGIFGWMVRISEIQQFPDFLETFQGNFRTISSSFPNVWLNGKRPSAGNWNRLPARETWKQLQATGCKGGKTWFAKCVGKRVTGYKGGKSSNYLIWLHSHEKFIVKSLLRMRQSAILMFTSQI